MFKVGDWVRRKAEYAHYGTWPHGTRRVRVSAIDDYGLLVIKGDSVGGRSADYFDHAATAEPFDPRALGMANQLADLLEGEWGCPSHVYRWLRSEVTNE